MRELLDIMEEEVHDRPKRSMLGSSSASGAHRIVATAPSRPWPVGSSPSAKDRTPPTTGHPLPERRIA